jgi:hypothetical protein
VSKRQILHVLIPAAGAIVAAFLIELGAQTTGWAAAWTYVLAGLVVGFLVIIGVPFALGYRFAIEPIEVASLPAAAADLSAPAWLPGAVAATELRRSYGSRGVAAGDVVWSEFLLNIAEPTAKLTSCVSTDSESFMRSWQPIVRAYGKEAARPRPEHEDVMVPYSWDTYLAKVLFEASPVPIASAEGEPREAETAKPSSWRPAVKRFVVPELAAVPQAA